MPDTSSSPKRQKSVAIRQKREKALMVEQLKKTPIVQVCCEKLGMARSTYYEWRRSDPVFAKATEDAIEYGTGFMNDLAESQLLAAVRDGNLGAVTYWLKHRHPAFATKMEVTAHVPVQRDELTADEKTAIVRSMRLTGVIPPSISLPQP